MIEIIDDKKREKLFDDRGDPYYRFYLITKENGKLKTDHKDFTGQKYFKYASAWIYNEKLKIERWNKKELEQSKKESLITSKQVEEKINLIFN
jgi:hypothetical protein